jgi:hypothetical protein
LTASTSSGCFFLDSSVLLSEILRENIARLDKFKKDVNLHGIQCFFTQSVKDECDEKIERTLNFLGSVIRESVAITLEDSMRRKNTPIDSPMTAEDIVALEELFSMLHGATRATLQLTSPIQVVEEWSVAFLGERLQQRTATSISQFLVELVKKILSLSGSIQDPYDDLVTYEASYAKSKNIVVDAPIVDSLRGLGVHEPDATHVACAICHSVRSGEKSVFVTFDYGSILSKKEDIKGTFNQICCDPIYALYHLIT